MRLVSCQDPAVDTRKPIGDRLPPEPRTCLLLRAQAREALFVSLWSFTGGAGPTARVSGSAGADVAVEVQFQGRNWSWHLPVAGAISLT